MRTSSLLPAAYVYSPSQSVEPACSHRIDELPATRATSLYTGRDRVNGQGQWRDLSVMRAPYDGSLVVLGSPDLHRHWFVSFVRMRIWLVARRLVEPLAAFGATQVGPQIPVSEADIRCYISAMS